MKARLLLALFFILPTLGSGYMTWLTWRADDGGQWLFLVFTVFFALLLASPWLPKLKTKPPPEPASTRFVPHWFMMLAALVLVAIALSVILAALRQFF